MTSTKNSVLAAATLAIALMASSATTAYADGREDRHERRGHDRHWDNRHSDNRHWNDRHDRRRDYDRHERRRDWHHDSRGWSERDYRSGYRHGRHDQRRFDRGRYIPPYGYRHHSWRRGDRLPRGYYSSRYIVHDYHAYHLSPPPRGHHWVRVNDDVFLAAIASGLVVSIVDGMFY